MVLRVFVCSLEVWLWISSSGIEGYIIVYIVFRVVLNFIVFVFVGFKFVLYMGFLNEVCLLLFLCSV